MGNEKSRPVASHGASPGASHPHFTSVGNTRAGSKIEKIHLKILLLGAPNVGKSSLLARLRGESTFNPEYHPSSEIDVQAIEWAYRSLDDPVSVEVWDCVRGHEEDSQLDAAQLKSRSRPRTGSMKLGKATMATVDVWRGASAAIVLYAIDDAASFDTAVHMLHMVPGTLPIMLVGNKKDQEARRVVPVHSAEAAAEAAAKRHVSRHGGRRVRAMEASCADCFGLRSLYNFVNVPYLEAKVAAIRASLEAAEDELGIAHEELNAYLDTADYDAHIQAQGVTQAASGNAAAGPAQQGTAHDSQSGNAFSDESYSRLTPNTSPDAAGNVFGRPAASSPAQASQPVVDGPASRAAPAPVPASAPAPAPASSSIFGNVGELADAPASSAPPTAASLAAFLADSDEDDDAAGEWLPAQAQQPQPSMWAPETSQAPGLAVDSDSDDGPVQAPAPAPAPVAQDMAPPAAGGAVDDLLVDSDEESQGAALMPAQPAARPPPSPATAEEDASVVPSHMLAPAAAPVPAPAPGPSIADFVPTADATTSAFFEGSDDEDDGVVIDGDGAVPPESSSPEAAAAPAPAPLNLDDDDDDDDFDVDALASKAVTLPPTTAWGSSADVASKPPAGKSGRAVSGAAAAAIAAAMAAAEASAPSDKSKSKKAKKSKKSKKPKAT